MALALSAFKRPDKQVGGVPKLWLIDKEAREASLVTLASASGSLTIGGSGGVAFEIIPAQNNVFLTETRNDSNDNNSSFVAQTLQFSLHGATAALIAMIDSIGVGRLEALVLDKNGVYKYVGLEENGLQSNGGDNAFTGQAAGDANGSTIILNCESAKLAPIADFGEFEAAFDITTP